MSSLTGHLKRSECRYLGDGSTSLPLAFPDSVSFSQIPICLIH
jgi:hypothetical protein